MFLLAGAGAELGVLSCDGTAEVIDGDLVGERSTGGGEELQFPWALGNMVGIATESFRFITGGWNSRDSSPTLPVAWAGGEVFLVKDKATNVAAADIVIISSKMNAMSNRRLLRPMSKLCPILAVSLDPKICFMKELRGRTS